MFKTLRYLFWIGLLLLAAPAWGQDITTAPVQQKYDSLIQPKATRLDSVSNKVNDKVDSVQAKLNSVQAPDVQQLTAKAKPKGNLKDSVQAVHDLDSAKRRLTYQIDSLKNLNLPHEKYSGKLDSLERAGPGKFIGRAESKVDELESKVNQPMDNVESKVNEKLELMNREGGAQANIPGSTTFPGAELNASISLDPAALLTTPSAGNPLGQFDNPLQDEMSKAGELKQRAGDIKNLPQEQLDRVKSIEEVEAAKAKLGEANEITDKAQAYQADARNLAQGNIEGVKQLPEDMENKAVQMSGLGGVQGQAKELGQYKELGSEEKAKQMLTKEAMQQLPLEAKNHFEGNEDVLKVAMDKMSKLKTKYTEVKNLNDSLKTKSNSLHGRPLIQRIVPGITFQILKTDMVEVDYNPWLAYRLNRRLTVGAGWNERFGVRKKFDFTLDERIYGPRVFIDLIIKKGFSVRIDTEKMNTGFTPLLSPGVGEGSRAWVWSCFVGFKKQYQFAKRVKGNFQFLYNIYDDNGNSPYVDRFNVRFGFEFPLRALR